MSASVTFKKASLVSHFRQKMHVDFSYGMIEYSYLGIQLMGKEIGLIFVNNMNN
jgi:hypothetical protein